MAKRKTKSNKKTRLTPRCFKVLAILSFIFAALIYIAKLITKEDGVQTGYAVMFLVIGIILYFCAFVGPIGLARYKLPMIPFYLSISAFGLIGISTLYKKKN